jgi:ABC-type antimicrobial peptide transport system permease subunit
MARNTAAATSRGYWNPIPPSLTIALWQVRQSWRLLLLAGVGILAAVMLVCTVPLFSQVSINAGFRNALNKSDSATTVTLSATTNLPTKSQQQNVGAKFDELVHQYIGSYVTGEPSTQIFSWDFPLYSTKPTSSSDTNANQIRLIGNDDPNINKHLTLISGALPATTTDGSLEIALPQATATELQVKVGSTLYLSTGYTLDNTGAARTLTSVPVRVSGIFGIVKPLDVYWNGAFGDVIQRGSILIFDGLTSSSGLLSMMNNLEQHGTVGHVGPPFVYYWQYALDVALLQATDLDTAINQSQTLIVKVQNTATNVTAIDSAGFSGSAFEIAQNYAARVVVYQVPVTILLLQVFGLVLFFLSVMAELVVDRQAESIVILRSRGANRRQVFGALSLETIVLGVIALIVGPLLAIGLVRLISTALIPSEVQSALKSISGNPVPVALSVRWYAIIAVGGAIISMVIALSRTAGLDILATRREASRATIRPLWQRLNLDLVFSVIGIVGYAGYVISIRNLGSNAIQLFPMLSIFSLIAPIFLLLAAALLFLRIFPLLTYLGATLASRGRTAPPMIALAQLSRSPRQAMRTTLLLALSTGLVIFTLVLTASQNQRAIDVANFTVGADFQGTLPVQTATSQTAIQSLTAQYRNIPGVQAASVGAVINIPYSSDAANVPMRVLAVDGDTFPHTAIWSNQYSDQSLSDLIQSLTSHRANVSDSAIVPVIVDETAWEALHLSIGSPFTLNVPGYTSGGMHFIVVAKVAHIPTIFDSIDSNGILSTQLGGGFLVDYQSYSAAFLHDLPDSSSPPTNIWLRSQSDASSLAGVRAAISSGSLKLTQLQDRRSLIASAQRDPLQIDLAGVQGIGAMTAILLALIGTLTASWLSARGRLVNFAVLRALGTDPAQLRQTILWEQGVTYGMALVVGIIIGAVLSSIVLPTLVFTNLISTNNNGQQIFDIPPVQTVVPVGILAISLGLIVAICVGSIVLMARTAARPSISQTLRLNED